MLFSSSRTILSINKGSICWTKGKAGSGKLVGETCKKPWSEENLAAAVADIAKRFPQRVRVVVGEEFSYATSFTKEQTDISNEVHSRIPENLKEGWDYQQKNTNGVEIMAVQEKLFSLIRKLFSEAGLVAEAIETESASISRLLPEAKNTAVLFARYDAVVLVGAVKDGSVLAAEVFDEFPVVKDIMEFTDYLAGRFGVPFDRVYVQEGEEELEKVFREVNLQVEKIVLDPMVGICKKKRLRGRDSEILNIRLDAVQKEKHAKKPMELREKILLGAFILVFILCAVFIYYILQSRKAAESARIQAAQTQKK